MVVHMVVQLVSMIQLFIITVNCFVETVVYIRSSIHTWQIFFCLLCDLLLLDCLKPEVIHVLRL